MSSTRKALRATVEATLLSAVEAVESALSAAAPALAPASTSTTGTPPTATSAEKQANDHEPQYGMVMFAYLKGQKAYRFVPVEMPVALKALNLSPALSSSAAVAALAAANNCAAPTAASAKKKRKDRESEEAGLDSEADELLAALVGSLRTLRELRELYERACAFASSSPLAGK